MTYEKAREAAFSQGMVLEATNYYSYYVGDYRERNWDSWTSYLGYGGRIETGLKKDPLGYLYDYDDWYWAEPPVYPSRQLHQPEGPKEPAIDKVEASALQDLESGQAVDPNDKLGPGGFGTARYIPGLEPLSYVIRFENLAAAGAPAQIVDIVECLQTDKVDLTTFRLGTIAAGQWVLHVPPEKRDYHALVDLRPERDLLVEVTAVLDEPQGQVRWRYKSIDPVTGALPTFDGFLPPNLLPPEGQGSVSYTVEIKADLPAETEIGRNCRARIVFDRMEDQALLTNDWVNHLDKGSPISQVSVVSHSPTRVFRVAWSGSDPGSSGIRDYTIFSTADNAAGFGIWRRNVSETEGLFTGQPGRTYAFYSLARDQVFNRETAPNQIVSVTVLDQDGDGIADGEDNCPGVANPDQADDNANGVGDACEVAPPTRGDLDGDQDVDNADLSILLAARNKPASGADDPRDLDRDGRITVLDARKLVLLCTRPRCATR
jgi:hypothetical protein